MCILNEKKLLGFIDADSNSKYILMQTKSGKIFSVERNSLLTWIGRHITWLTGRSYQLPTIVDTIKNSLTQKEGRDLATLKILQKINIRIEHYNLNHKTNIGLFYPQESTGSLDSETVGTQPEEIEHTYFEEKQTPAKVQDAERSENEWGLQVQFNSTSGNLYATSRKTVVTRSANMIDGYRNSPLNYLTFDPRLQNVFIRYQMAVIYDEPFFTIRASFSKGNWCGYLGILGEHEMDINLVNKIRVYPDSAFQTLELSVQEKEVLMEATKFLAHAANVDRKHSEECRDKCVLSMKSLDALDSIIDKISSFISDNEVKFDNDFYIFVEQIKSIKYSIGIKGSRYGKRAIST